MKILVYPLKTFGKIVILFGQILEHGKQPLRFENAQFDFDVKYFLLHVRFDFIFRPVYDLFELHFVDGLLVREEEVAGRTGPQRVDNTHVCNIRIVVYVFIQVFPRVYFYFNQFESHFLFVYVFEFNFLFEFMSAEHPPIFPPAALEEEFQVHQIPQVDLRLGLVDEMRGEYDLLMAFALEHS